MFGSNKEKIIPGVIEGYDPRELDYSQLAAIDIIVKRSQVTSRDLFLKSGKHDLTFSVYGESAIFIPGPSESNSVIKGMGMIYHLSVPFEMQEELGVKDSVKLIINGASSVMSPFCYASCGEISREDGFEALSLSVEHSLGDRRFEAKIIRNKRSWSLQEWIDVSDKSAPVAELTKLLPDLADDPMFANCEVC